MSQEARGLDPKDWVVPTVDIGVQGQAHWWLFKPIKQASYRRYDDWAEKLACELAHLLKLPCARVELAHGESDRGIISANVTPNGWSMESGDTMLSEFPGYLSCAGEDRPKNRIGHNLSNVEQVLEGCAGPPGSDCADWAGVEVFAGFLVFDAWVANTDRHAINWGVLTCEEDGRHALAASFRPRQRLGVRHTGSTTLAIDRRRLRTPWLRRPIRRRRTSSAGGSGTASCRPDGRQGRAVAGSLGGR
jgi:hypothetical protein